MQCDVSGRAIDQTLQGPCRIIFELMVKSEISLGGPLVYGGVKSS